MTKQTSVPAVRLRLVRERAVHVREDVSHPAAAAAVLERFIGDADTERLAVVLLDSTAKLLAVSLIATGGLSQVSAGMREIFKAAVVANASAIILGHNHPSGNPSPSPQDEAFTARVVEAGVLMGIPVMDHVIVTPSGRRASFVELGLFPSPRAA